MNTQQRYRPPNIILILIDDMGYGDLGCYGNRVHRTGRLDAMAAEGMRFTDFYAAAPLCSPSRAAILTGCYSQRVGLARGSKCPVIMPGDSIGLNPAEPTLARLLKSRGYATALVGKWHLGDQPEFLPDRHGFDFYFGLPYSNDMGLGNSQESFPPLPLLSGCNVVETEPDQASLTGRYTAEAERFIRSNADRPFFLFFSHMYVHVPLFAPDEYLARSQNGPYGAEVEEIDASTGRLLDTLAELGLDEHTLVIFTSDNGATNRDGSSNGPLRGTKGSTWEGGLREPCLMRWPGHIPAGSVCRELATAMDLLPTLAGLAGAKLPAGHVIDGHDILPLLTGRSQASLYEAFFYYFGFHLEAVRQGRWKYHLDRDELYDLATDVGETLNVSAGNPEIVAGLKALAAGCVEELGDGERVGWKCSQTRLGRGVRQPGRVANPRPLTGLDGQDPLVRAEYD